MLHSNVVTEYAPSLFLAVRNNNLEALNCILKREEFAKGEQIDAVLNEEGLSPMHLAACLGYFPIIKALSERGAKIDIPSSKSGNMPIHFAASFGHFEAVKSLVYECKVPPNVQNTDGLTPLDLAKNHGKSEFVALFEDEFKPVRMHFLLLDALRSHDVELVKWLVKDCKVDPSVEVEVESSLYEDGSPLHYAAAIGFLEGVQFLVLQCQVNPNLKNRDGHTPLHQAVCFSKENIVEWLLLTKKVDVNVKDNLGATPLHYAAEDRYIKILKLLFGAAEIDPDVLNNEGQTPLFRVLTENAREVWEESCTDACDPFCEDISCQIRHKRNTVNVFLERGVNISLSLSCMEQHRDEVEEPYEEVQEYEKYHQYLYETETLVSYFSSPTQFLTRFEGKANKDRSLYGVIQSLQIHKELKLRNKEGKTLFELMLQNFLDKAVKVLDVSQNFKDRVIWFFATQYIREFQFDSPKNKEEHQLEFGKFMNLIERFANSIDGLEEKESLFWELADKFESLTRQENGDFDYTDCLIEAYEAVIKFTPLGQDLQMAHQKLAFLYLRLNSGIPFVENDARSQKAFFHALKAGDSDDIVRLRKYLIYGFGEHDNKEDPSSPALLWQAFSCLKKSKLLESENQYSKTKEFLNKANDDADEVISKPIAGREDETSGNKRGRTIAENVQANQGESPPLLHYLQYYGTQGAEIDSNKIQVDFNMALNDTGENALKRGRMDEGSDHDAKTNDNNNNNIAFD